MASLAAAEDDSPKKDNEEAGTGPLRRSRSMHVPTPEEVNLMCPISLDLFEDPVVASDGHTYSRAGIEWWLKKGNNSSPKTREPLERGLFPNRAVAQNVQQYKTTVGLKLIELIERRPDEPTCEGRARDMLEEGKADLNARREQDRRTPLLVAAELGLRGLVDALIDHGADYKATDSDGKGVEDFLPALREEREAREKAAEDEDRKRKEAKRWLEAVKKKAADETNLFRMHDPEGSAQGPGSTPAASPSTTLGPGRGTAPTRTLPQVDWNAVERVVGRRAVDQMKQGEGFTGALELQNKSITDEGCRTIAPGLRTMPNLEWLYLWHNNIGDNGLASICRVLPEMVSLGILDLRDNNIGTVGCQSLLELVENGSLPSLTDLDLGNNPNISFEELFFLNLGHEVQVLTLEENFRRVWVAKGKDTDDLYF